MPSPRDINLRRRRLRDAVSAEPAERPPNTGGGASALRSIEGVIVDASPHLLVLSGTDGEVRLPMAATATVWHGGSAGPSALRAGRHAVVRPTTDHGMAVDRVWVDIARVTGVIVDRGPEMIEVDAGPHRGRVAMDLLGSALRRVQVRHPHLEPGDLLDVIGVHRSGGVIGLVPAGAPQRASHAATVLAGRASGAMSRIMRGTATWYEPAAGTPRGAAYPALDPHGDAGGCPSAVRPCAPLPYLSLGSDLYVRNDCADRGDRMPVVECGCLAARFCDRCVYCGTSPRGRIVELTKTAFVDLGGDLDQGCFNVTAQVG